MCGRVCIRGDRRSTLGIGLNHPSPPCLRQSLLQDLKLADLARMAGQGAPAILSWPPQHWDYRDAPPYPAFHADAEALSLGFHVVQQGFCQLGHLPSLPSFLFNNVVLSEQDFVEG